MNTTLKFTDENDFSMPLPEFVIYMGMFVLIILTNAISKIYLLLYKINHPAAKVSSILNSTKGENSR